jgi:hypothetical protein
MAAHLPHQPPKAEPRLARDVTEDACEFDTFPVALPRRTLGRIGRGSEDDAARAEAVERILAARAVAIEIQAS